MIYSEPIHQHLSLFCFKLILLISLFVLFISIKYLQAKPKLEFRQTLEKTSVITGEGLRETVYLKNSGDELLKIRGVSSSCGCTTHSHECIVSKIKIFLLSKAGEAYQAQSWQFSLQYQLLQSRVVL